MSDGGESEVPAERTIRRLLIRYGRASQVAWFGTIHDLQIARGDAVVVLTTLGEWSGQVLRVDDSPTPSPMSSPSSLPTSVASSAAGSPPPLSGEVLRRMSELDQEKIAESRRRSSELLESARKVVHPSGDTFDVAAGGGVLGSSVAVLDVEISLCGRFAVLWFAGRSSAALGPQAVRLADAFGLERVQWMAAESSAAVAEDIGAELASPPQPRSATQLARQPQTESTTARTPVADESQSAAKEQSAGVLNTFRALRAIDPGELGRMARLERERLGMVGAYAQKIRGEPTANGSEGAAALRRRWMLRIRATAGGVTIGQLNQLAQLAMRHGDGSLRLTMRQGLQMHGVVPGSAVELLRAIESLAMTTRGSCGNAFRNVTCCPLPPRSPAALAARQLAATVTQQWLPRAEWLSWIIDAEESEAGEWNTEAGGDAGESDAAYREGYLPHKWKVGVATADDNCIDVLTNDVGLIVHSDVASGAIFVDCYVGGSLAYRPGVTGSAAMLAEPLGRVSLADVGEVLGGLTQVHRQISNSGPRHWRRLKYLVRRVGTEALAERIEHEIGRRGIFSPIDQEHLSAWTGHPSWTPGMEDRWTRTIEIVGGRLRFGDNHSGENWQPGDDWLRLCRFGRAVRIGPRHSLVIDGIEGKHKQAVDALIAGPLAQFAAEPVAALSEPPEDAGERAQPRIPRVLACVALPTCPLAVAEAERAAPEWRRALEPVMDAAAVFAVKELSGATQDREPITGPITGPITVAISGCSNGCSHPLTSTIGIVAEGPRQFRIFVGGDGRTLGISLGTVAGPAELATLVRAVAERFRAEGEGYASFADWWKRRRN